MHSSDHYRQFDQIPCGVVLHGGDGSILHTNPYMCDLLGSDAEEIAQRQLPELFCDAIYNGRIITSCEIHPALLSIQTGKPEQNIIARVYNTRDQSYRWVDINCSLTYEDGMVKGAVSIYTDITEQIKKNILIQEDNARLTLLVESLNAISWELDLETGKFIYVSPYAEKLLGYPLEAWESMDSWKSFTHPEDREWAAHHCELETVAGRDHDFSYRMIKKDGTIIWVRDVVTVIKDMDGRPVKLTGFILDVTDLYLVNTELETKVAEEVEKNRQREQIMLRQNRFLAVGEMLGFIAHQWRQPLNTLGLLIQDLADAYAHGEMDQTYLNATVHSSLNQVNYLSKTIDNFRSFFTIDQKKENFSVQESVENVRYLTESRAKDSMIRIIASPIEEFRVTGYKNEFLQALTNLVTNAIEAIENKKLTDPELQGEIVISSACQNNAYCQIVIRDNGGGIEEATMAKIFDPYFTTKFQDQGTGIGLYMSKIVIEKNMGGTLNVRNVPEGCEFTVTLPFDKTIPKGERNV